MKYIRVRGEKFYLGRVELDFTPEWISVPTHPRESVDNERISEFAVPRARIAVRGSDKGLDIRDPERLQRLRDVTRRSRRMAPALCG